MLYVSMLNDTTEIGTPLMVFPLTATLIDVDANTIVADALYPIAWRLISIPTRLQYFTQYLITIKYESTKHTEVTNETIHATSIVKHC